MHYAVLQQPNDCAMISNVYCIPLYSNARKGISINHLLSTRRNKQLFWGESKSSEFDQSCFDLDFGWLRLFPFQTSTFQIKKLPTISIKALGSFLEISSPGAPNSLGVEGFKIPAKKSELRSTGLSIKEEWRSITSIQNNTSSFTDGTSTARFLTAACTYRFDAPKSWIHL